jgi:hypothetical protein
LALRNLEGRKTMAKEQQAPKGEFQQVNGVLTSCDEEGVALVVGGRRRLMSTRAEHLDLAIELADFAYELVEDKEYEAAASYSAVSNAYAAVVAAWGDCEPSEMLPKPRKEMPPWCGECDHPHGRWVEMPLCDGETLPRLAYCPRCHPRSLTSKEAVKAEKAETGEPEPVA